MATLGLIEYADASAEVRAVYDVKPVTHNLGTDSCKTKRDASPDT